MISAQTVRLDPAARRAWNGDTELDLNRKEFELLHALVAHAGHAMGCAELMRIVWKTDDDRSTKTINVHIAWLRRKLGDSATSPTFITTIRGHGFRFETEPPHRGP